MPHGGADRLLSPDQIDFAKLDAALRSGGDGEEGERLALTNDLLGPKRFGRIFPDLPPFRPADDGLTALGLAMQETGPATNSNIPAGFTYFGQFVDHDLTRDPSVGFPVITDADHLEDARTPAFDLDSVYGMGPELQPELYDPNFPAKRARFKIGHTGAAGAPDASGNTIPGNLPNDLPRGSDRTAFIGDSRNDENLVIAQTHLAFLKFHNKVIATLPDDDHAFEKARRLVKFHYHAILLDDFLARILDPDVLADVRQHKPRFVRFQPHRPFMPIEFSVAAYRLGHSMVRPGYNYNRVFHFDQGFPRLTGATLGLLFQFTGAGGLSPNPANPNPELPSNWVIDWRLWHEVDDAGHRSPHLNMTLAIDTRITAPLFNLPKPGVVADDPVQLAVRNLLRGSRLGLPRAQDVAKAMGVAPLAPGDVAGGTGGDVLRQFGFDKETPLWFYILREAEVAGGNHLGQIGSRIVAETFVALLRAARESILHDDDDHGDDFKPTLPRRDPDKFTFADLLLFVNDINPIGPDPAGF